MAGVVNKFKSRDRAPGSDGITSRNWGVIYEVRLSIVESAFNVCLRIGTFLECWKCAILALLSKSGKPKGMPSSYRLLCLLEDVWKIFKSLLERRVEVHIASSRIELADNQFDFWRCSSYNDAVLLLTEQFENARCSCLGGCHWVGHPQRFQHYRV